MNVFVDSTTLLYTLDPTDVRKRAGCVLWLKTLRLSGALTMSPQVLNETYSVVMRKPAFGMARAGIRTHLSDYAAWVTAPLNVEVLVAGWRLQDRFRVPFWDCLLLASANAAGCAFFLSEDLNDGKVYGEVRVIDPFRHAPADVLGRALS
ncbi:MAG: PIN domain-containing protein [Pseudomonadota bacterium]|nr:PIN domain-containing protein [Pseudomonadota bacterium]